jgi:hypothetical protein
VCAEHLGDAVQSLAVWARNRHLQGNVEVLAIAQLTAEQQSGSGQITKQVHCGFAFGTILVDP